MQFPHSCGYDTPRQKPYTHTYGGGREKKKKKTQKGQLVKSTISRVFWNIMWQTRMTGRPPMGAHFFFFFFGRGWCDVKKPWTTQSLSSRAGSGRRRSPAEPQLGEFHSGGGGELIRRHVRKIREGKQALGKHGSDATAGANANANVLLGGVANALEGTVGPICFSAVYHCR